MEWKLALFEGSPEGQKQKVDDLVNSFASITLDNISVDDFKKLILLKEEISREISKLYAYYHLQEAANTKDAAVLAKLTELEQWGAELDLKLHHFRDWFVNLEYASKYIEACKDHTYYLESVRKLKPHMRSKEVEEVLTIKNITGSGTYSQIYTLLTSSFSYDFNGQEKLPQEKVTSHYMDPDPKLREQAYNLVLTNYGEHAAILTELYKNVVMSKDNEGLKIRKYATPISMRNFSNDIPDEVVTMLLGLIRKNAGIFVDYFKKKHELIGSECDFSRYHLYAPYPGTDHEYGYESAKKLVLETYKEFSEEFYLAAKEIFDKEHVHVFPKQNKRGGAFCYSPHNQETPFILLNHTDKRRDLFTMMHEFGHGIHGVLARKQNEMNYHTALPMAETASIFGEMILSQKLLASADVEDKKSILVYMIDGQWASIVRQAYFVMFEREAHDKIVKGATEEELNKIYVDFLKEQFGDMTIPYEFKHEWKYIPHIYHTPFYCYAYAWGELLSLSLYKMYLAQGDEFREKFTAMLASGGDAEPLELLKRMGVDATDESFWQGGFDLIKEEIEQLLKL